MSKNNQAELAVIDAIVKYLRALDSGTNGEQIREAQSQFDNNIQSLNAKKRALYQKSMDGLVHRGMNSALSELDDLTSDIDNITMALNEATSELNGKSETLFFPAIAESLETVSKIVTSIGSTVKNIKKMRSETDKSSEKKDATETANSIDSIQTTINNIRKELDELSNKL